MTLSPIAIDGFAASGKGTLARQLASHFDFAYLDTGSLYRGIAHIIFLENKDPDNFEHCLQAAKNMRLETIDQNAIRSNEIGLIASKIAQNSDLRIEILNIQREFANSPPHNKKGAVLDGRDIGTVVCPEAPIKFFVTACPEIRANRRWLELKKYGNKLTQDKILQDILRRDQQDLTRKTAPLKQAENALLLDSSYLAIEEVFKMALQLIEKQQMAF